MFHKYAYASTFHQLTEINDISCSIAADLAPPKRCFLQVSVETGPATRYTCKSDDSKYLLFAFLVRIELAGSDPGNEIVLCGGNERLLHQIEGPHQGHDVGNRAMPAGD
jgi:hypothetical protein